MAVTQMPETSMSYATTFPSKEAHDLGVSQNYGYHFGGPNNEDYSILGSILGSPYFGKLPFNVFAFGGRALDAAAQLLVFQLDQQSCYATIYNSSHSLYHLLCLKYSLRVQGPK